jgi:hypothetical protein
MRRLTLASVALLFTSIALAGENSYRLAGSIVTADQGTRLALVETADGTQRLLREGDSIDGGLITEITRDRVFLQFGDQVLILKLEGTDEPPIVAPAEYAREDYPVSEPIPPVDAHVLNAISILIASSNEEDSEKTVSEVLRLLGLPAQARVSAVNDQGVDSPAEALREIAAQVDARPKDGTGLSMVISLAAIEGNRRVYVLADAAGHADSSTVDPN